MDRDTDILGNAHQTPERINGFAPGDRVGIVNCELAGAYGKVEFSNPGCEAACLLDCHLVWVDLSHKPDDVEPNKTRETFFGEPNTFRFKVGEVTHID